MCSFIRISKGAHAVLTSLFKVSPYSLVAVSVRSDTSAAVLTVSNMNACIMFLIFNLRREGLSVDLFYPDNLCCIS